MANYFSVFGLKDKIKKIADKFKLKNHAKKQHFFKRAYDWLSGAYYKAQKAAEIQQSIATLYDPTDIVRKLITAPYNHITPHLDEIFIDDTELAIPKKKIDTITKFSIPLKMFGIFGRVRHHYVQLAVEERLVEIEKFRNSFFHGILCK